MERAGVSCISSSPDLGGADDRYQELRILTYSIHGVRLHG